MIGTRATDHICETPVDKPVKWKCTVQKPHITYVVAKTAYEARQLAAKEFHGSNMDINVEMDSDVEMVK